MEDKVREKFERNSKLIMEFNNLSNWKPNYNQIAKKHNIPVSTVSDFFKRLESQCRIDLYVNILSEEEAEVIFLKKQLKEKEQKLNSIKD